MQRGFNKVEILVLATVVIALILIFLNFIFDTQKSIRDTKRRGDIETIAKQLEVHFNRTKNEFCPSSPIDSYCQPKSDWFTNEKLPLDPLTGQSYLNLPQDGDKKFLICAKLEKGEGNSLTSQDTMTNSGYYYCSRSRQ